MFSMLAFDIIKDYVGVDLRTPDGEIVKLEWVRLIPDSEMVEYKYENFKLTHKEYAGVALKFISESYGRAQSHG